MKIELSYREPGTKISAYIFNSVYNADKKGMKEALEERAAAERAGYEVTVWRLVHDEDVTF